MFNACEKQDQMDPIINTYYYCSLKYEKKKEKKKILQKPHGHKL